MSPDDAISGLQVFLLPVSARVAQAFMAVISVGMVTLVYTLLIRRGSLMATTSLYPRKPIEANIGTILETTWPQSSRHLDPDRLENSISLFYIGKMASDSSPDPVAKGRIECVATPAGQENRHSLWLAAGSPLTKNVVQLLIWEWVTIGPDSYPRLTVILIYIAAYISHFCYVWMICLRFFRIVFGGAAWSLLERSKFVVGENTKLRQSSVGSNFSFRSIDKASEPYVPQTFNATIGSPITSPTRPSLSTSPISPVSGSLTIASTLTNNSGGSSTPTIDDQAELRAALATIDAAQKTERATATEASTLALDRVIGNAMVMMGVTLSSGFASWTSSQLTDNSPNNTTTNSIGSLALLASLTLGAAAMFTSAMHLDVMASAFATIAVARPGRQGSWPVRYWGRRMRFSRARVTMSAALMRRSSISWPACAQGR
ncbi:hypothetical protein DRE_01433 [Drechslerella stenobrocha 248]|uniref:Uncharacterized protein n=1 Tax=Drechslerella stenobrocha 248 TaxID=1043628 RepID=W7HI57_9PEZI|nr:hypothetical protein DRE_01433 [Drechslerella stenobrocha 248]